MAKIISSALEEADYETGFNILDGVGNLVIDFDDGVSHRYFNVPRSVYRGLLRAPSKGKYFNSHIRNNFRSKPLLPQR